MPRSHAPACKPPREIPPGKKLIFRPWITLPNGSRLYAWQVGKRVFPLIVDDE
jgi:hypothetical protein